LKAHHLGYRLANFQNHVTNHLGDIKFNAQVLPLVYALVRRKKFNKCEMIQLECQEFSPRLRNVDVRKRRKFLEKKQSTHIRQRRKNFAGSVSFWSISGPFKHLPVMAEYLAVGTAHLPTSLVLFSLRDLVTLFRSAQTAAREIGRYRSHRGRH
jgi:hypothetical protein